MRVLKPYPRTDAHPPGPKKSVLQPALAIMIHCPPFHWILKFVFYGPIWGRCCLG